MKKDTKLETENPKLVISNWKLETGDSKLGTGNKQLVSGTSYQFLVPSFKFFLIAIALLGLFGVTGVSAQQYLHPGINIKPNQVDVNSNLVYATHAGFVTYAGPAPSWVREKGWMVQVESDFNRDNVPDVVTRYTHLQPRALMVNDVHYKREVFTPSFFASKGRSLPYGNGPYVTRNQMIGIISDSGSPGDVHIQYEIVTSRQGSLFGVNLNKSGCEDSPYIEQCSDDPSVPGLFFSINRKKPDVVKAPIYVNPGLVTPIPGKSPRVFPVHEAPEFELPEPPLPRPDFLPPPPPVTNTPTPRPPQPNPPVTCVHNDEYGRQIWIDGNGELRFIIPGCGGHFQVVSPTCDCGGWHGLPQTYPCPFDPTQWCNPGPDGDQIYYGGPWCVQEGCTNMQDVQIIFEGGYNNCPHDTVTLSCH